MKKVLLIGSHYGYHGNANGVCLKNIANEFLNRGYMVYVISDSVDEKTQKTIEQGVNVYRLEEAWYSQFTKKHSRNDKLSLLYKSVSILRKILLCPLYPNVSPIRSEKIFRLADRLIKENGIQMVLCSYRPYESIYTAIKLKKKYQDNLIVFNYHLDVLTEPNTRNAIIRKFQICKADKIVQKEFRQLDCLILPNNLRQKASNQDKVIFTDFPVYVPSVKEVHIDFEYSKEFYNVAYIGTLNLSNRNPAYAIYLFEELNKISKKKFRLHLWGNIDTSIMSKINELDWVNYHGYIDNAYVMDLLKRSDYLLNITNENTFNMLPSKIVQMFAAQRPIFNFVKNRGDCSLTYFKKYGHVVNIYEDTSVASQMQAVMAFTKEYEKHLIDFSDELIKESTPGYLIDKIERRITDGSYKK